MNATATFPALALTNEDFEALASGGATSAALTFLEKGERSRRLLLLRQLLASLANRPELTAPLGPWDHAWSLLERAAEAAPADTDGLLTSPQTGSWLAHTLRRLNGQHSASAMWTDVGRLFALGAAAALRSGIDADVPVPLREGTLSLPGLGLVTAPGSHPEHSVGRLMISQRTFLLATDQGSTPRTRASGQATPYWRPLTVLQPGDVTLDDLDPYRDLDEPVAPQPLSDNEATAWQSQYAEAHAILTRDTDAGSVDRGLLQAGTVVPGRIRTIVPWQPAAQDGPDTSHPQLSASTGDAYASMVISRPPDAVRLAETLVHEFQHSKLAALLHHFLLLEDDRAERYYAPWRSDPRHLTGLLHGAYAFTGVAGFWRLRMNDLASDTATRELAAYYFALRRLQARLVVRTLSHSGRLSPQGKRIVEGLARTLGDWLHEDVPAPLLYRARTAARLHRTEWRLRNMRPGLEDPVPTDSTWPDSRTPGFAHVPAVPTTADEFLAAGDPAAALSMYVGTASHDPAARAGALVAAALAQPGRHAASALARPETTPLA
ncbi:HEXXH motif-containing putative peptide modification protein [Streptomyces gilvifuscus]|uniref:HEXXH motif-containing putative peptide modification protein n=1 Tax=Streptomyces gilvifuscus TaxID=1550617 RepID=A0ABT5FQY2_9ACTN|nr:HEXXH motif-containing putative peptide modification protein [Streptomyces gilvifuscus]MDC2954921.1 HEXXH motif-containing putative peptide modification protein [Streptomyces gilvifuscus]